MRNFLITFIISIFVIVGLQSQDYNIGVRAGLNYSSLQGETEVGETLGYSQGIHFGINFSWNFTDIFALRGEVLYISTGGTRTYSGPSYYVFRKSTGPVYDTGEIVDYFLDMSNASISLPLTAHFKPFKKWEVFGGGYVRFLLSPTAAGRLDYESTDDPDNIFFIQSLDYNYFDDLAGGGNAIIAPIELLVDGELFSIPKIAGAYYQFSEVDKNLFNKVDFGLVLGTSYYFNPGFYTSVRLDYGFRDMTRTISDVSLVSLNSAGGFITREDNDTHLGLEFSLGFKF